MKGAGVALARVGDDLRHAVRFPHGTAKRLLDGLTLMRKERLGVRDGDAKVRHRFAEIEHRSRELVQRRRISPEIGDAILAERPQIVNDQVGREVVRGHVELVEPCVPHPERRTPPFGRRDELATEDRPAIPT